MAFHGSGKMTITRWDRAEPDDSRAVQSIHDGTARWLVLLACVLSLCGGLTLTAAAAEPVSFPGAGPAAVVTLTGTFYQAAGAKPQAVVLLHTCGGLSPHEYALADWFVSKGHDALVVDSFGPRHVTNVCNHPAAPRRTIAPLTRFSPSPGSGHVPMWMPAGLPSSVGRMAAARRWPPTWRSWCGMRRSPARASAPRSPCIRRAANPALICQGA